MVRCGHVVTGACSKRYDARGTPYDDQQVLKQSMLVLFLYTSPEAWNCIITAARNATSRITVFMLSPRVISQLLSDSLLITGYTDAGELTVTKADSLNPVYAPCNNGCLKSLKDKDFRQDPLLSAATTEWLTSTQYVKQLHEQMLSTKHAFGY